MKKVFCMRGLPGSGKNTWIANKIANDWQSANVVVCSSDDYFMVNGEYKFNESLLGEAHKSCFRKFMFTLAAESAEGQDSIVVVNNTNISNWEISPYSAIAQAMDYEFEVIEIKSTVAQSIARNTHGVRPETIGAMAEAIRREILLPFWKVTRI